MSSAQWRSSRTTSVGCSSARCSRSRRTAQNSSSWATPSADRPTAEASLVGDASPSRPGASSASTLARAVGLVVRLGDPGGLVDELADRPVGDALAVGQAAPDEGPATVRADPLDELPHQAALADTRRGDEGDEVRGPLVDRPAPGVGEGGELPVPARPSARRGGGPGPRHRHGPRPGGTPRRAPPCPWPRSARRARHRRRPGRGSTSAARAGSRPVVPPAPAAPRC